MHAGSLVAAAASKAPVSHPLPAQHPTTDDDDYCAICAAIHLASSSFLPDAPQLPVPFVFSLAIEHSSHVVLFSSRRREQLFNRAPLRSPDFRSLLISRVAARMRRR